MNKFKFLIVLITLISMTGALSAAKKNKIYEKGLILSEMKDMVIVNDSKGGKVEAKKDAKIMPGFKVRTGPGSSAILVSLDGDTYTLDENSAIKVSKPLSAALAKLKKKKGGLARKAKSKSKASTMAFLKGKIQAHVKPGQKKGVNVKTAVSVLSVKGTTFAVETGAGADNLDVLDGEVGMEDPDTGESIAVGAGMSLNSQNKKVTKMSEEKKKKMKSTQSKSQQSLKSTQAKASSKQSSSKKSSKKSSSEESDAGAENMLMSTGDGGAVGGIQNPAGDFQEVIQDSIKETQNEAARARISVEPIAPPTR